jgi:tetratricopeptide (TPR) repeat protein
MAPEQAANPSFSDLFDLEDQADDLLQAGAYADAVATADAALAIDPKSLTARLVCAQAQKALGRLVDAASTLEKMLGYMPGLATVHADVAALYVELDRLDEARDHLIRATEIDPSLVDAFVNLGSVYMRMGHWDLAEIPTRHAIFLDAGNLVANQNLIAIEAGNRDQGAVTSRDEGARPPALLVERAYQAIAPTVLILSNVGAGNVPHQHLLPRARFSRIFWFLEDALPEHESEIPDHDIVFNAVGDVDAAPEAHALAGRYANVCKKPMINLPDRVDRTSRAGVAELLAPCENAVIPKVRQMERPSGGWTQDGPDLRYPLIARPAGRHGGEGAVLVERPDQFLSLAPDAPVIYATEFVDYRSPDNWYRKYRAIFVDRKPYPYHLAIGAHWLLHHWTAGMEQDAGRRNEELRFLENPQQALGDKVWATLEDIGARLDLDFVGIDFSVLQDGRLLLFEANPTMLVHPEDDPLFAHKNFAVQNILDAFERMITGKMNRVS